MFLSSPPLITNRKEKLERKLDAFVTNSPSSTLCYMINDDGTHTFPFQMIFSWKTLRDGRNLAPIKKFAVYAFGFFYRINSGGIDILPVESVLSISYSLLFATFSCCSTNNCAG